MKLSNQALGTIMMALQKSLLTQTDVTQILRNLDFSVNNEERLVVENPPTFEVPNETLDAYGTVGSD